ncbi:MAG TPA: asparagine synthetase B [Candidatus Bathyarchaeia archaeon]|nr:asparagine synthetase B [Candidatus Bathyarchaeia archaeon]
MGGIVAAFSRKGDDVVPLATRMLRVIGHRNGEGCRLYSKEGSLVAKSPDALNPQGMRSNMCIGHNRSPSTNLCPPEQNAFEGEYSSVFEGRIFSRLVENEPEVVRKALPGPRDIQAFVQRYDGDYVLATMGKDEFAVYRDPVGIVPLYFAEDQKLLALASEKKSLWAIGLSEVNSFPPGNMLKASGNKKELKCIRAITQSQRPNYGLHDTVEKLTDLIEEAVNKRAGRVGELALAFSGGLDSGILSKILQREGIPVHLICVGMNDSAELSHAETVASDLDLPINIRVLERDEIEDAVSSLIWHLEDADPLKACLGIAFYFVAQEASRLGKSLLMSGQGCDELFGGYLRHLRVFKEEGGEALRDKLLSDVKNAYEASYEPNSHVCAAFGVEHTAPYADLTLINYALGIPAELNFGNDGVSRKAVLREVAKQLGLPESVYDKPKKAFQYGSGVDKVLRRIALDERLELREYLSKRFTDVFALEEHQC